MQSGFPIRRLIAQDKNLTMKEKLKTADDNFFRELNLQLLVHDLKDPLAVINSNLRMLLERQEKWGQLTSRQDKTLKRTLRSTEKARDMVYTLLEIGQSQAGDYHCSDFDPVQTTYTVLTDALETMTGTVFDQFAFYKNQPKAVAYLAECGVVYEIMPSVMSITIYQDSVRFCQIVGNLIKNALYYRRKQVCIRMKTSHDRLVMEIVDDGPGIAPEYHEIVFNNYTQVKECALSPRRGHGLGLAGARLLAHSLNGKIELESEKGQSTLFRLILPLKLT